MRNNNLNSITISSIIVFLLIALTSCSSSLNLKKGKEIKQDNAGKKIISNYKDGLVTLKEAQDALDKLIAKNNIILC